MTMKIVRSKEEFIAVASEALFNDLREQLHDLDEQATAAGMDDADLLLLLGAKVTSGIAATKRSESDLPGEIAGLIVNSERIRAHGHRDVRFIAAIDEVAERLAKELEAGDLVRARRVNARMLESFAFETGDLAPNPIPTKAMLRTHGWAVGQCRLPMGVAPDWVEPRAREVWANLEASRG